MSPASLQSHGNGRLALVYQPRVDLPSGRATSVEALVRWVDTDGVVHMPDSFIPQAERNGDIIAIGTWVIDEAVRQAARWCRSRLARRVAFNVSPCQLDCGTLLPEVLSALRRHGVPPDAIEVEITEGMEIQDEVRAARTMRELRLLGVHVSIDDFGSGYAGISRLKWLPADALKLDKSLVDGLPTAPQACLLVGALVAFAHGLGSVCVAEGVETAAQVEMLMRLGCDQAQGYYFSRPTHGDSVRSNYTVVRSTRCTGPEPSLKIRAEAVAA